VFLDRESECSHVDRVLASAARGVSSVLVLRGEPGIGKTALLGYAIDAAAGFDVARLAGIESETELGFAALHQLLLPFLDKLDSLPQPQHRALATAFGLSGGGPPDRFLVGLATLTMLSAAATARPLLCVVDDAQWLDRESADVLAFAARRLRADAVGVLFAVRDPAERRVGLQGLPELRVGGLPAAQARELLASAAAGIVDDVSGQIIAQTGGNPLGLIELGRELTAGQLAGEVALPEPLPLGPSLEARFLRQVRGLPAGTRTLLLTVAADPTGDPALLWRAGERLGFDVHAAGPAEARSLLDFWPPVRFRHPLIRSAVYHGASVAERARVHVALAEVTDPARDADLRAWHRAAAATGPDEVVAAELEKAADRARKRGGWAATGAFLARAAELTPDGAARVRRVLAAAQAEATAGTARAQILLDSVTGQLDDPRQRSLALRVQAVVCYTQDRPAQAASLLVGAAREVRPLDIGQARRLLLDAIGAAKISGRFAGSDASEIEIARAARSMALPPQGVVTAGDLLLDADTALLLDGLERAAPLLRRSVTALLDAPISSQDPLTWTWMGCLAAGALGDDDALHSLANRLEFQAREQGAVPALSAALHFTGLSELFAGALGHALVRFTEREAIKTAFGGSCQLGQTLVLAWRGQSSETRAQAAAAARIATERGHGWKLAWLEYAIAVLELGWGHYEQALVAAPQAAYEENVLLDAFALPDVIEAAVRCGQRTRAEWAMDRIARRAATSPTPLALGLLARSRALLEDGPDAEALYQEAITHLRKARGSSHLARTHLLYGEWLRWAKRRRDAREQLRAAHGMFEDMGAGAFAERARLELSATGETARKRSVADGRDLTPQEAQVAALAATGATNPEIAAKLFISPKTVDYHLGKAYRKLGVSSRRELARLTLDQT
jgi:DNA-binding CsgD family transcriptional regulator